MCTTNLNAVLLMERIRQLDPSALNKLCQILQEFWIITVLFNAFYRTVIRIYICVHKAFIDRNSY